MNHDAVALFDSVKFFLVVVECTIILGVGQAVEIFSSRTLAGLERANTSFCGFSDSCFGIVKAI